MKRSPFFALFSSLAVLLALTAPIAFAQKITTFDFPGGIATTPTGITPLGRIVGYYGDQTDVAVRGFVRNANGSFTSFNAPNSTYTVPTGMNPAGQIIGFDGENQSSGYVQVGFMRSANGTIATFMGDPSAAVTSPEDINAWGQVVGYWVDPIQLSHGFLRNPNGTITSFDAGSGGFIGTIAVAINLFGQSTGYFDDFTGAGEFGFLREPDGKIITFDVLNATNTQPVGIDPLGQVAGHYTDFNFTSHGFLRKTNGTIITFDVPGATDTTPVAINSIGQITGFYADGSPILHGFLREDNGYIITFDVPNATKTVPAAMNLEGEITGVYYDSNGDQHGFVRNPTNEPILRLVTRDLEEFQR